MDEENASGRREEIIRNRDLTKE